MLMCTETTLPYRLHAQEEKHNHLYYTATNPVTRYSDLYEIYNDRTAAYMEVTNSHAFLIRFRAKSMRWNIYK